MEKSNFKSRKPFSAESILQQLDGCAEDCHFPMLDNGYVYLAESRLSTYQDDYRWAIIIEVIGFNYRAGGHNGIENCLYVFGNCLTFNPGINNDNFLYMTGDSNDCPAFDEEYQESLNPITSTIKIRDKVIQIKHDIRFYLEKGIVLEEPSKIMIWEFLRGLVPEYRQDLLATEAELRERIPVDIPEFMRLEEWYHPDLADGEKPSQNETFQLLARAMTAGDPAVYQPTKQPNNHWRNWPMGGTL